MGSHPVTFRRSKILRRDQPACAKRHRCPEVNCSSRFKRLSDLERHRKCVHDCRPVLGDSHVYRCAICAARRKRLDHFKKHAKREHPTQDLEILVRESAEPVADSASSATLEYAESRRRGRSLAALKPSSASPGCSVDHCGRSTYRFVEDDLSDSAISILPSTTVSQTPRFTAQTISRNCGIHDQPRATALPNSGTLSNIVVDLFRSLYAKRLNHNQASQRHTAQPSAHSTNPDHNEVPVDGDKSNYGQASGSFRGLLPSGSGGGNGGWSSKGKGKQPIRGPGSGPGGASSAGSFGSSEGPASRLPCVYHLFHAREDDPTRDCATRKRYICYLWPHHYRAHRLTPTSTPRRFICCSKCFRRFNDQETQEAHRRDNACIPICLDSSCDNYNQAPSLGSPCPHGGYFPPELIWQRLYREAHGLGVNDWVPDPTLDHQDVPAGLPAHHPMSRWSAPVPNQFASLAVAHVPAIPVHQPANLLAGVGGGINGVPPNFPAAAGPAPLSNRDLLRTILEILWGRVNTRVPSWSPLAQANSALVPRVDIGGLLAQDPTTISETMMLQVLAAHFAMVIQGGMPRTPEVWLEMRRLVEHLMGDLVEVPFECPWDLQQPAPRHPEPQIFRAALDTAAIDPALEELTRDSLSALDATNTLASTTSRDLQPIPRASLDATNQLWHVRPDQSSQYLSPQTPTDRRRSFGSLTSPSDGPYYSAPSSLNATPLNDRSVTTGSQWQAAVPSEDFSEFFDMGDDEEENEEENELDDLD